jgi:hypothetical protein
MYASTVVERVTHVAARELGLAVFRLAAIITWSELGGHFYYCFIDARDVSHLFQHEGNAGEEILRELKAVG